MHQRLLWGTALLFLLVPIAAHLATHERSARGRAIPEAEASRADTRTAVFRVESLFCSGCASTVAGALKNTFGVEDAWVDHHANLARVRYHARRVSIEEMRAAIDRTGFPASEMPP